MILNVTTILIISVFITGEKIQTLFDNMNCELPNLSNWFNAN